MTRFCHDCVFYHYTDIRPGVKIQEPLCGHESSEWGHIRLSCEYARQYGPCGIKGKLFERSKKEEHVTQ